MDSGVSIAVAFLAGLLTFVSPCLLPIIPAYLGYLSGATVAQGAPSRLTTLVHASLFVLGLSVVLVAMGASVGFVGGLALDRIDLVRKVGGAVVILLGLQMAGLLRIPVLTREIRWDLGGRLKPGYTTSVALGVVFGVGWTPCVGPTLAAILVLASASSTVWQGAGLLSVYALGLGVPFLLTAAALDAATKQLRRLNSYGNLVSLTSGTLLVLLGILLYTNQLQRLSSLFGAWVPFNL